MPLKIERKKEKEKKIMQNAILVVVRFCVERARERERENSAVNVNKRGYD